MNNRSTFSLIGDRYLDTQHSQEYIEQLETELKQRGITGAYRYLLEYLTASSLWWNILWWEWCELNEQDVKFGWYCNAALFLLIGTVAALLCNIHVAIGLITLAHISTTALGIGLHFGTKAKP